jgi:hypothetical protein
VSRRRTTIAYSVEARTVTIIAHSFRGQGIEDAFADNA